jgi:hypothetical protein
LEVERFASDTAPDIRLFVRTAPDLAVRKRGMRLLRRAANAIATAAVLIARSLQA